MYYWRFPFATRPLRVLDSLRVGPCFALRTLERIGRMQLGPPGRPTAVRPRFWQAPVAGPAGNRAGRD
jgi:hypothetical protein